MKIFVVFVIWINDINWRYVLVFYFSLAKNIAELLLLQYEVVVLHLSCLGPLYVMDTYQEYEDQHKYTLLSYTDL
jgi:hypothetical protein